MESQLAIMESQIIYAIIIKLTKNYATNHEGNYEINLCNINKLWNNL